MSEAAEPKAPAAGRMQAAIQPPWRMLRSPSHESVTTDLSLFSVSSIASEAKSANRLAAFKSYSEAHLSARGPSPNPDSDTDSRMQSQSNRPEDIPEILWFEEETELIRSCGALSSALGLQKSFSTSDVSQLPSPDQPLGLRPQSGLRSAVSLHGLDLAHREGLLLQARLEHASRSCSTWVAVGDVASTSQLPSPHGGTSLTLPTASSPHPAPFPSVGLAVPLPSPSPLPPLPFTPADLVRSVNKKVRQNYIRRRLLTTYKALERLSQSEFNLDRLEAAATAAQAQPSGASLVLPAAAAVPLIPGRKPSSRDHALTVRDVERERGKQLSKYERNMMIFNWLHTLDDTTLLDQTAQ